MQRFTRGACPKLLSKYGASVGEKYAARRAASPNARFRWPKRERQSLYDAARAGTYADTNGHCAYCDGFPLGAQGRDEVDHFRPTSQFPLLACEWTNLFLSCTACNGAKSDQWDERLLRPDEVEFSFGRFFLFRSDNGELEINPRASAVDQERADVTIRILDLNRDGLCILRMREMKATDDDRPYRFLLDAVGPSP